MIDFLEFSVVLQIQKLPHTVHIPSFVFSTVQKGLHKIINSRLPMPSLFHSDVGTARNFIKIKPAKFYKDGSFSKERIPLFGTLTRTFITQFAV